MRRRRKRDIVIELTALLDIIMILIFMVMNENSKLVSEAQNELSAVQQENIEQADQINELSAELAMLNEGSLDELLQRLESAESRLEAYQALDDEVIILNVKLENKANNSIRSLSFGEVADPNSKQKYNLQNDNERDRAYSNLRAFIHTYISSSSSSSMIVRVVFSYDSDNVFEKDFKEIDAILEVADTWADNNVNFEYKKNQQSS